MFSFEVTRATTPFAPSELEGEYKLTIKGRHMKMVKIDDGIKARATCNKTDDWNLADGINTCLERIKTKKSGNKIKVGDRAKVTNPGKSYRNYIDWVCAHCKDMKDVAAYRKGCSPIENLIGEVVCIASHGFYTDKTLAYIRVGPLDSNYDCYLVEVSGLEKI